MTYIQRKDNQFNTLETVDEFTTRKEARIMLKEYQLSDSSAHFYMSQRPCKEWSER